MMRFFLGNAGLLAVLLAPMAIGAARADDVNLTTSLRVGDWEVSGYLFDKYHQRFVAAEWQRAGVKPDAVACRQWLDRFVVQQVAVAQALRLGYGEHAAVRQVVERMERTVLTQPDGLLERSLTAKPAGPPVDPGRRLAWRAERRARQLAAAEFSLDLATAEALAGRLALLPPGVAEIPPESVDESPLLVFRSNTEPVAVSGRRWADHFNGLFLRRLPRSVAEVRTAAEDFAMEELDLREARTRGLDRTPQFGEDRRGFLGWQALEWFERERLRPRVRVEPAEIARYHATHAGEFSRGVRAEGRLVRFATAPEASRWVMEGAVGGAGERCTVGQAQGIPGCEPLTEALLALPAGRSLGPVPRGGEFVVFVKERDLETTTVPLAEAAPEIRRRLERKALEALERAQVRAWCEGLRVEVNLDPARFGVSEPVAWPWES